MTPDEARRHVEHRLRELGWKVHIGAAGYEKISRIAASGEADVSRLCHKLVALGALQDSREITDDVVDMAMLDLDAPTENGAAPARADAPPVDRGLIDELAATLEARMSAGAASEAARPVVRPRPVPKARPSRATPAAETKPEPSPSLPKLVLVEPAAAARAAAAQALSGEFRVIAVGDAQAAWNELSSHDDVALLMTRLALPTSDAEVLVRRVRETPRLARPGMLRIIVLGPEQPEAKARLLAAGADEFIGTSVAPAELRACASAQRRQMGQATRANPDARAPTPAPARPENRVRAPVETLIAERRYEGAAPPAPARRSGQRTPRRGNTTATITVASTVLLAFAMLAIFFASHDGAALRRYFADTTSERSSAASGATGGQPPAVTRLPQPAPAAPSEPGPPKATAPNIAKAPPKSAPPASEARPVEPKPPVGPPSSRAETPASPSIPSAPDPEVSAEALDKTAPSPAPPTIATRRSSASPPERSTAPTMERPVPPVARAPRSEPVRPESPILESPPARPSTPTPESATTPEPAQRQTEAAPGAPAAETPARSIRPTPSVPRRDSAPPPTEPRSTEASPPRESADARQDLARAESPPAAVTPAPPLNRISRDELSAFLTRFASVYEAGDLGQFMSLFSDNARTNDRNDRNGIRQDYESLFRTTDVRRLDLGEISWEVDGRQAQGWGEFTVSVRRRGDSDPYRYTGSLTFVLEKVDGRLRIVRLYHGQRRVES